MTELLYLSDSDSVTEFETSATHVTGDAVILEETYFYPGGGGQPADRGVLLWETGDARVVSVHKDHGDVHHEVKDVNGTPPEEGMIVTGQIDEQRRDRLSRMHSAQHVMSRVVLEEYDATTAGNQIHLDHSRIDFEPADFDDDDLALIERLTNEAIERDLPVTKDERPREMVKQNVTNGRSNLELLPDHVDKLRVVEIGDFDLCPCGGTHVDRTGEIGGIEIINRVSKGKNVERIEFTLLSSLSE